jgi:inosine triphosphate pyrophosphatase
MTSIPSIIFVTGKPDNMHKLKETNAILGISLSSAKIDLPELQGEPEDVAKSKSRYAYNLLKSPVLIEDTSLCYNALGGLPGVYVKWFLDKTGQEGLFNMLAAYKDNSAYTQCIFAYCFSEEEEPILFVGRCTGQIVSPRGPDNFGWDTIFQPDNEIETFAEMPSKRKNEISHRARALEQLKAHFSKKQIKDLTSWWYGPFNIKVPNSVEHVPWIDGCNSMRRGGSVTEKRCVDGKEYSKKCYLAKYCELMPDGCYWWKV